MLPKITPPGKEIRVQVNFFLPAKFIRIVSRLRLSGTWAPAQVARFDSPLLTD
jgi:hypothetical protein